MLVVTKNKQKQNKSGQYYESLLLHNIFKYAIKNQNI